MSEKRGGNESRPTCSGFGASRLRFRSNASRSGALQHREDEDAQPARIQKRGGAHHPPAHTGREAARSMGAGSYGSRRGIRDGESAIRPGGERRLPGGALNKPAGTGAVER